MDKKTKIFFLAILLLFLLTAFATYYRVYILGDYYIQNTLDCDPETEKCFVSTCDPESDSECPTDPEDQVTYYKLIREKAASLLPCAPGKTYPDGFECPQLSCASGEKDCREILCDPTNVPEGEQCNDPEKYLEENPPVDESAEVCAPDDEACLTAQSEGDQACSSDDENCGSNGSTTINMDDKLPIPGEGAPSD